MDAGKYRALVHALRAERVARANRGDGTMSLTNPEGVFGLIALEQHPDDRRAGIQGSRGPRVRAEGGPVPPGATIPAHEILGGQTIVTGLTGDGIYTLPAVIGPTGLAARGGLRRGDRVEWLFRNDSTDPLGVAVLAADALGTITMQGPLAVTRGHTLNVRLLMVTALTAACFCAIVGPSGVAGTGRNLFSYVDILQETASGSTTMQGSYDDASDPITVTAQELLSGHTAVGVPGISPTVVLPAAADVAAALLAKGITAAAGLRLPPLLVSVGPGGPTINGYTPGAGVTIRTQPAVARPRATVYFVFTSATTADAIVIMSP